jgi:hypothetical protein
MLANRVTAHTIPYITAYLIVPIILFGQLLSWKGGRYVVPKLRELITKLHSPKFQKNEHIKNLSSVFGWIIIRACQILQCVFL